MHMQPLALRGLQHPVAGQVVAVVARETRGHNAAESRVLYHSTAGHCSKYKWKETDDIEKKKRELEVEEALRANFELWITKLFHSA